MAGLETGTKISGIGHLVLIGWAVLGGAFQAEPLPFEVQDVSVVTAEDFAALMAAQTAPAPAATPAALVAPEPGQDQPDIAPVTPEAVDQAAPETAPAPPTEAAPEQLPEPLPPEPATGITDAVPILTPPSEELAALPPSPTRPRPRPAQRIAPTPVAAPPPDSTPDDVEQPEVSAEEGAEAPQPEQEATAPEEATDRIDPEAEDSALLAPKTSPRPPSRRPSAPARNAPADTGDAVQAALQQALGDPAPAPDAAAPTGPPLTAGEKDNLRVAVSKCWNVGSLSSAALATTVIVAVSMGEDGKPIVATIRMIGKSGGDDAAASQAFGAARRAIIRCAGAGYPLPAEKYGQWREIEMTFNPERMRIR